MTETRELTIYALEGLVAGGDIKGETLRCLNLETGKITNIPETQARQDTSWDMAFKRSVIYLNSGPAGPGDVQGALIDPPVDVSREDFVKITADDLKRKFDSVTTVPPGAQFRGEDVEPAIFDWRVLKDGRYTHNSVKGWKLRLADGARYAKMRMKRLEADCKAITIQYAYQPGKDAPLDEERMATINPGECFNFKTGSIAPESGMEWDIKHDGSRLLINSSVSGPGRAGALGSNKYGATWKNVENPSDSIAYFMDEFGAVFRNPKWYRYNIDGKHNLHPNGAVYAIKTLAGVYKLQVYEYFEHKGSDLGNFRIRYARLA
ncbi:MAG: HmuY family protein [Nitrospinae bacterium]|nr:HmuY family protein [Nitrospinota bacterium]